MNATLIGILSSIAGLAFMAIASWIQRGQAQVTGQKLEAAAVTATTASAETSVAQAEAAAPKTTSALVDRLKAGNF